MRRAASLGHRCGSAGWANDNDVSGMLCLPHRWDMVVVRRWSPTASVGHRCGPGSGTSGSWVRFFGREFWSTPQRGPRGAMAPSGPGPGIPAFLAFGASAAGPREAGALYVGKNNSKVPPPPEEDPQGPPHSNGNAPVAHGCVSFRVTSDRRSLGRRPVGRTAVRVPREPGIQRIPGRRSPASVPTVVPGAGARTPPEEQR